VPAHVRTEAAAVHDVVTETARAAAEAVKLAATTTAADLRAAASAGLVASGAAVRSCWYQVHADLTETEAEERAEREAARIGLVEARARAAHSCSHCVARELCNCSQALSCRARTLACVTQPRARFCVGVLLHCMRPAPRVRRKRSG
jgi:hypothetical protein